MGYRAFQNASFGNTSFPNGNDGNSCLLALSDGQNSDVIKSRQIGECELLSCSHWRESVRYSQLRPTCANTRSAANAHYRRRPVCTLLGLGVQL